MELMILKVSATYRSSRFSDTIDNFKIMSNINSIQENTICNLANIITGENILLTMSNLDNYQYFTKYYCPTNFHYSKSKHKRVGRIKHYCISGHVLVLAK